MSDRNPGLDPAVLTRWLPAYDVNEVHSAIVPGTPETALDRMLALPAAPDAVVRTLFRIRRLPGGDLPLEQFGRDVLGMTTVLRTPTAAAMVGTIRGIDLGISFESAATPAGTRLTTETRAAAHYTLALVLFRAYWLVVGPFSALIRRRWLRALRKPAANPSGS